VRSTTEYVKLDCYPQSSILDKAAEISSATSESERPVQKQKSRDNVDDVQSGCPDNAVIQYQALGYSRPHAFEYMVVGKMKVIFCNAEGNTDIG
jgi:hypothetical protein